MILKLGNNGVLWELHGVKIQLFEIRYFLMGSRTFELNKLIITCKEVFAISDSKFSTSQLHFLYCEDYGFVKLHYFNVDKTEIIFSLIT